MTGHAAITARPTSAQSAAASATSDGCRNQSSSRPFHGNQNAAVTKWRRASALSSGWSHACSMGASANIARESDV
jgi:hypothetical protein